MGQTQVQPQYRVLLVSLERLNPCKVAGTQKIIARFVCGCGVVVVGTRAPIYIY